MFLSGKSIRELAMREEGALFDDQTYDERSLKQASYDLRLGESFFQIGEDFPGKLSDEAPYLVLRPGQFAFLTTYEVLHLPFDVLGLITLRNTYKRQGLVNISGFHVDPTFHGRLTFAVQNIGPNDLRLRYKDCTFTIFLSKVDAIDVSDAGEPRPRLMDDGIPLELIQHLGGSTVTLAKLQKEIEDVKTRLLIYAPLAVAALVPLLILLINVIRSGKP